MGLAAEVSFRMSLVTSLVVADTYLGVAALPSILDATLGFVMLCVLLLGDVLLGLAALAVATLAVLILCVVLRAVVLLDAARLCVVLLCVPLLGSDEFRPLVVERMTAGSRPDPDPESSPNPDPEPSCPKPAQPSDLRFPGAVVVSDGVSVVTGSSFQNQACERVTYRTDSSNQTLRAAILLLRVRGSD